MERSFKRLLLLALLFALPAVVQAQLYYTDNGDGTATIAEYSGPGGAVTIPSMTNGLTVTSIGDYAFYNCTVLTNVTIPNNVTNIGRIAFAGCSNLTDVTIPDDVTAIGDYAFYGCASRTGVAIPASVTSIGSGAFYGCTSLTAITVDVSNQAYSSMEGVGFDKSHTTIVDYPNGKAGAYTIPSSVTVVGDDAFAGSANLTGVTFPNGLTDIRYAAFQSCISLTSVVIPSSVTNFEAGVFFACDGLTAVYFKGNAPSGGESAFYGNPKVAVYYLPGTTGWGTTFGGHPTALWLLQNPLILAGPSFGVKTNAFGFIISWATNVPVVVEVSTNLAAALWSPVATNSLTGGTSYFSDPQWTNYPARFYRLRSP